MGMDNPFSVLQGIAEERIRAAQEAGEFDNLPGRGAPLSLEDESGVPEELRMAYKLLKNAGCLPPELQERKDIANLAQMLEHCEDERVRVQQMRKLEVLIYRAKTREGRNIALAEVNDAYFDKILDRIQVARARDRKG